jgi:predicted O-methyltransferase YrrM
MTATAKPATNSVLQKILADQSVSDGVHTYPLHSHLSETDGDFIRRILRDVRPTSSLEIGMAFGVSTLFICEVLDELRLATRHIVVDPFQTTDWHGIGLKHVRDAGFDRFVEFHEERSEYFLPKLTQQGHRIDFALIDGWHSFEHALVEFFYISRMLRVGGVVLFDDSDWPAINKLLRYLIQLPGFEVYAPEAGTLPTSALGAIRRRIGNSAIGKQVLHPSFRRRTWELGLQRRCVALRKVAEDTRDMKWFEDF